MCTKTFSFDDNLLTTVSQKFGSEESLTQWMQMQLNMMLMSQANMMVAENRANRRAEFLTRLEAVTPEDGVKGFFKLKGILGPTSMTDREMADEYLEEKYDL